MTDIVPKSRRVVRVAENFGDLWQEAANLRWLTAAEGVSPDVGRATLRWRYGNIRQPGDDRFRIERLQNLQHHYVQIGVDESDAAFQPLWYGIVDLEGLDIWGRGSKDRSQGLQDFVAMGLAHVLDRLRLEGAWVWADGGPVKIGRLPSFNRKRRRGPGIIGNKSANGLYFGTGETWTNRDILTYILVNAPFPGGLRVSGQVDLLDSITDVYEDLEGRTIKEWLDRVIPQERGLGWTVRVGADLVSGEPYLYVHIFSGIGRDLIANGVTLKQNTEQHEVDLERGVGLIAPRVKIQLPQYHSVLVYGQPILSCFSLGFLDGTLEAGWTAAQEAAYKTSAGDEAGAKDRERSRDAYRDVYQRLQVPSDWDWTAGDGYGGAKNTVTPSCDDAGRIFFTPANVWPLDKTFERYLPLAQPGDSSDETEYQAALAVVIEPLSEEDYVLDKGGTRTNADGIIEDLPEAHVRPSDSRLAFSLNTAPNHALGFRHFDKDTDDSNHAAIVDYESTIITAAIRTDERPHVKVNAPEWGALLPSEDRVLRLYVPDAEVWYVAPQTVTDVAGGTTVHHAGGLVRDDTNRLRTIALLAAAWHCTQSAAISFGVQGFSTDYPAGSYIWTYYAEQELGGVVTQRTWDAQTGATTWNAGRWNLSLGKLGAQIGHSRRGLGGTLAKVKEQVKELEIHTGNIPARYAPIVTAMFGGVGPSYDECYDEICDDFNYTEDPLQTNWKLAGGTFWKADGSDAVATFPGAGSPTTVNAYAYHKAFFCSTDQQASVDITQTPAVIDDVFHHGLVLRHNPVTGDSPTDGAHYVGHWESDSGVTRIEIYRIFGGSGAELVSELTPITAPTSMIFSVEDQGDGTADLVLTVGDGATTHAVFVTDTSPLATGSKAGMNVDWYGATTAGTAKHDNWCLTTTVDQVACFSLFYDTFGYTADPLASPYVHYDQAEDSWAADGTDAVITTTGNITKDFVFPSRELCSDDHTVTADSISGPAGDEGTRFVMIFGRCATTNYADCYYGRWTETGGGASRTLEIHKEIGGVDTQLSSKDVTATHADCTKLQFVISGTGLTLTGWNGGASDSTNTTNGDVTTGKYVGFGVYFDAAVNAGRDCKIGTFQAA